MHPIYQNTIIYTGRSRRKNRDKRKQGKRSGRKGKSRRLACRPDCQLSQRIHQVTWGTTRTSHRLPSQFVGRPFAGDGPANLPQEAAPSGAVSCNRHVRVTTPGPGAVSMPPSPLGYLPTNINTRS
eukprot:GHVU01153075.1.p1 GENE.GHVU01153075.1~~GHVU01153075.1.p1  ORF type:complete len:126 (-),score=1.85 GHVU01153075.1:178-555(-)